MAATGRRKPAGAACSPSAMCGRTRPSAWEPRSAKARKSWRRCTRSWPRPPRRALPSWPLSCLDASQALRCGANVICISRWHGGPMIRSAITILALALYPLAATPPVSAADGQSGDATTRPATEATRTPRIFRDCADCPEMVETPAGEFVMGSPPDEPPVKLRDQMSNESPQHRVTIAKPFAAGRFEATFAEWDACVADKGCVHSPSDNGGGRDRRPVVNVSWNDITREYIPWLSRKTGKTYRLLTEAEREHAGRARNTTRHSTGNSLNGAPAT